MRCEHIQRCSSQRSVTHTFRGPAHGGPVGTEGTPLPIRGHWRLLPSHFGASMEGGYPFPGKMCSGHPSVPCTDFYHHFVSTLVSCTTAATPARSSGLFLSRSAKEKVREAMENMGTGLPSTFPLPPPHSHFLLFFPFYHLFHPSPPLLSPGQENF